MGRGTLSQGQSNQAVPLNTLPHHALKLKKRYSYNSVLSLSPYVMFYGTLYLYLQYLAYHMFGLCFLLLSMDFFHLTSLSPIYFLGLKYEFYFIFSFIYFYVTTYWFIFNIICTVQTNCFLLSFYNQLCFLQPIFYVHLIWHLTDYKCMVCHWLYHICAQVLYTVWRFILEKTDCTWRNDDVPSRPAVLELITQKNNFTERLIT
jgi:hypothetical protein